MIVWGGKPGGSTFYNDGASYNPATDSWIAISSPPTIPDGRWHHCGAWDGSQMLVWGGQDATGVLSNGGQYDPSTDAWGAGLSTTGAPAAMDGASTAWDGQEMIIWGGYPGSAATTIAGGRYNPLTDSWAATTQTNAPTGVRSHAAVWAGSQMIIWGGYNGSGFEDAGMKYVPPVSLSAGTYQATIKLSDPRASNSPQTITVTLTVTP
jgi:N-acetylneuraminic acid mutarotase